MFKDNQELRANFLYYCRVQRFAQEPAISEERQRTKMLFQQRAKDLYDKEIKPQFSRCSTPAQSFPVVQSFLPQRQVQPRKQNVTRTFWLATWSHYTSLQSLPTTEKCQRHNPTYR
jgi:hypothetical protein